MRPDGARAPSGSVRVDATILALSDGRHLAYTEYGDPDGDPVIGFHGTPGGRHQLAPLDEDARRVGVRLIVPDRPGYGDSDLVPDRALADWPGDVADLVDHLGLDRFAILGISGGGPHALACAADLGDRVTATAIASGVAPFGWDDVAEELPPLLRPVVALVLRTPLLGALIGLGLWLLRTWPRLVLAAYRRWLPPADVAVLDRPGLVDLYLAGAHRMSPTAARAAEQDLRLFMQPWQIDLAAIQTPVHVWHGDADKMVPVADGRWTAGQVADATFHLCRDGGHLCVVTWAEPILEGLRAPAS